MTTELNIFGEIGWQVDKQNVMDALAGAIGDINVNISSYGGDVFEGIAIANLIQQYKGKTVGKGMGIVASAATLILLKCTEKKMAKNSFFMLHNSWGNASGNAENMSMTVELLKKIDEEMVDIYVSQIKKAGKMVDGDEDKTYKKIKKMMQDETWLTADEALELGFIDEVMDADTESNRLYDEAFAKVRASAKNFKNIPNTVKAMEKEKEKKSFLQQLANWLGFKAEISEIDAPVALPEATEKPEAVEAPPAPAEQKPEQKPEINPEIEASLKEKEEKLKALQKEIEEKEAELKAKITYKTELKDAPAVTGFTEEQIKMAGDFIKSLMSKK